MELVIRRYMKEIMRYGIPKHKAKEIVETAFEAGKGKQVEKYIQYAVTLIYGLNFFEKSIDNRKMSWYIIIRTKQKIIKGDG